MTLDFRCSECGARLETSNADQLDNEIIPLLDELRQCQTELEEAANVIAPQYKSLASIYRVAAKRVAQTISDYSFALTPRERG